MIANLVVVLFLLAPTSTTSLMESVSTPEPVPAKLLLTPIHEGLAKGRWMLKVKKFEGFYSKPYTCAGGRSTIGYGFTADDFADRKLPRSITKEQADVMLNKVWNNHRKLVEKSVKVPLNPYQRAALVSFSYNLGEGRLRELVGRLNHGNYQSITEELPTYRKARGRVLAGLVKRRAWEASMFAQTI